MYERAALRQVVALILLVLLQAQAVVAGMLPCRHAQPAGAESGAHPCHLLPAQAQDQGPPGTDRAGLLDCPTCTLLAVAGVFAPQAGHAPACVPAPDAATALGPRHFYRFFPDRAERPPIPLPL